MRWQVYRLARCVGKVLALGYRLMSCTPLPKAAKTVRAKQLTRLPSVVVNVKFQLGKTQSIDNVRYGYNLYTGFKDQLVDIENP